MKPQNILVTHEGVPKLIDFGIAKLTGPSLASRHVATTRLGLLPLTPEYASPEQVRGETVTTESDVYSLGVVLYELLAGTLPYQLDGLSPVAIERTICQDNPPSPSRSVGSLGSQIDVESTSLDAVLCVAYSPTEDLLASAGRDGTIRLWNAVSYAEVGVLRGHGDWITSLAFSPDGKSLASASQDRAITLWNIADRTEERTWIGHRDIVECVAFSSRGGLLASGSADGTIKLWDSSSGHALERAWSHEGRVRCVAFSPDGKTLASGGDDRLIKLWSVPAGQLREILTFHRDAGDGNHVSSLAFSPDGKRLVSSGVQRTLFLWNLVTRCHTMLQGRTKRGHVRAISPWAAASFAAKLKSARIVSFA